MIAGRKARPFLSNGRLFPSQTGTSPLVEERLLECLAMAMLGDGLLALLEPRRHVGLWLAGPKLWRQLIQPFSDRPNLTRWVGAAEFALGIWLASRQGSSD